MATATMGTAATTTLTALQFQASMSPTDYATIDNAILNDALPTTAPAASSFSGGWARSGQLYVPNRGVLRMLPGDYVAFDTQTGWPILVSARAAAGAGWVHT